MKSRLAPSFMIIVVVLVVLGIIGGIFLVNWWSQGGSFSSTSNENIGVTAILEDKVSHKVGLNEAFVQIAGKSTKWQSNIENTKIFSVTGLKLDSEGKADSWLFIVKRGNKTNYIEFTNSGKLVNAWRGSVPSQEIIPEKIIVPEDIFRKYQARLKIYSDDNWIFYSLKLENDTYTLNLGNGSVLKVFSFNSGNGDIIEG